MISMRRTDRISISLDLDSAGLSELLLAMTTIATAGKCSVPVTADHSLIRPSRIRKRPLSTLTITAGAITRLSCVGNELRLEVDEEDLEDISDALRQCKASGQFQVAELIQVQVEGREQVDQIYVALT